MEFVGFFKVFCEDIWFCRRKPVQILKKRELEEKTENSAFHKYTVTSHMDQAKVCRETQRIFKVKSIVRQLSLENGKFN